MIKKIIFSLILFFVCTNVNADLPYYLDFKHILNKSEAGKKAQDSLKNKLDNGINQLKKKEKALQDEEKKIIQQKKIISAEEYKKKVQTLRSKVSTLQKDRDTLLKKVGKKRAKGKEELLKNLNPIISEYMVEKKIRMVLDKKSLLLADEKLDITQDILKILNKKLKTLKLN
jgi:outer membrane protein